MQNKKRNLKRVVTGNWREELKKLKIGEGFLFPLNKRESVAPELTKQKKIDNRHYATTEKDQPKGYVYVWLEKAEELEGAA